MNTDARCARTGKVQFIDEDAAKLALRQMRRAKLVRGLIHATERLHAYRCPACELWHLGKRTRK